MLTRRAALGLALAALAAPAPADQVFTDGGRAIRGIDPVAYFTQDRPVMGDPAFSAEWDGATWTFASQANRDAFVADPRAYAPQYGGFCAFAAAKGAKASIDPEAWTIHEGRLYLNFSPMVRDIWRQDIPGHVAAADANWPGLR